MRARATCVVDRAATFVDREHRWPTADPSERLLDDPDRAEVIGDLERSVGDRLAALVGAEDRLIATEDIDAILEEVGAVDTGRDPAPNESGRAPRTVRRLYRVREGKELAGVCTGLAAYSEIPVDWVRTIFVIGTLVTAGLLGLVYLALAFILPIEARPAPHP